MMLEWYTVGMVGNKPDMPAKGYTWKTTPQLNRWIWEKYNQIKLEDAIGHYESSYEKIRALIKKHSDKELFEKKRYKWTGSTSLGSYLVSCTSSHYDWALKLIKKAKK
ncbi:MAG: ClbS/DfsB family four-helix bundle protein [Bacteroidia bacterium]